MRSLLLQGKGTCSIIDVDKPVPGPGQVLIRTTTSALCGSELKSYRGDGQAKGNSGHEGIGVVEALGEGVTTVKPGDRVGVSAIAGCGKPDCEACAQGQSTWCSSFKFYGNMHAEYFLTAPTACLPLPEDVPDRVGVLITGDGLGVPYHTSLKLMDADIHTVAVFGLGPIGLGNVLVQSYLKRNVIAIDMVPERLELALQLGAVEAINAKDNDAVARIMELTDKRGVDAAIEAAGVPVTAKQCFKAVRKAGTVIFNGEQPAVELSPSNDFIRRDIRAIGSWFFQVGEYPAMLNLWREGLRVEDMVTHVFNFADAPEAFSVFAKGTTGKVLLRYE